GTFPPRPTRPGSAAPPASTPTPSWRPRGRWPPGEPPRTHRRCRKGERTTALAAQLRRAAAGTAGGADRRADPVRLPADPRVHPAVHPERHVRPGHVPDRAAVGGGRRRADHRAGRPPPALVPP